MPARSSQDLVIEACTSCTRSYKDLWQDFIRIFTTSSHKDLRKTLVETLIYHWDLQGCSMKLLQDRDRRDQERDNHFVRACVVEMHMDIWQELAIFLRIYKKKCRARRSHRRLRASLRTRNAHGHRTRAILRENLERKNRGSESVHWFI